MITNNQIISAYGIKNPNDRWEVEQSYYEPMLGLFGEIIVQRDESGYQGDTLAVIKNGNRYGYISFGWGSCSGCDALQGCDTVDSICDLANCFEQSVQWFESLTDLKSFVLKHDYEGDWTDKTLVKEFKADVEKL